LSRDEFLGLDFLRHTGMSVDVSLREFCFGFAPSAKGKFCLEDLNVCHDSCLQNLRGEVRGNNVRPKAEGVKLDSLVNPALVCFRRCFRLNWGD
jgi:hypothetical protein